MAGAFTISALATPPVAGGIGIIRISGEQALAVAARMAPRVPAKPEPRKAYLTELTDAAGQVLDEGLFIYFKAPNSFTGEDVVELQAHGSPRLLELLQAELLLDERVRPAAPGEFSRRAFLNGRVDLARAEAVADLVAAESEAAVRAAAAQVTGALSERVRALRSPLLELHADLEGVLSFPDEAEGAEEGMQERLLAMVESGRALLEGAARGRLLRRGARVVVFGPVNAGKSTLFNRFLGQERALVDDEPGTTRDVLEGRLEFNGLGLLMVDTAGFRPAPGRLESRGIERAREALQAANLAVLVIPPGATAEEVESWRREAACEVIEVQGKGDLASSCPPHRLRVSGLTGEGVEVLRERIAERLWGGGLPQAVVLTSERHATALGRAVEALERAVKASTASTLEVVSGEVGLALEALGEITGESASEELLDAIFQRFCIGK